MAEQPLDLELKMEENDLYQEEIFTDRRVGTIQRLTPIDDRQARSRPTGALRRADAADVPHGRVAPQFRDPRRLAGAGSAEFPHRGNGHWSNHAELEDMRREQASSLIVPMRRAALAAAAVVAACRAAAASL
jgi:hypothetical protein